MNVLDSEADVGSCIYNVVILWMDLLLLLLLLLKGDDWMILNDDDETQLLLNWPCKQHFACFHVNDTNGLRGYMSALLSQKSVTTEVKFMTGEFQYFGFFLRLLTGIMWK